MKAAKTVLKARCIKCRTVFEYEPVRTIHGRPICRHVCDECRTGRKKFLSRRWNHRWRDPIRKRSKHEPRATTLDGYVHTLEEIGQHLKLNTSTVEMAQRSALAKIRASTELREAFQQYTEAGMPRVKELLDGGSDRAERLLELQMQVADFWQVYETLQQRAQAMDTDPLPLRDLPLWRQRERRSAMAVQEELAEIMGEIIRMQGLLKNELEKK